VRRVIARGTFVSCREAIREIVRQGASGFVNIGSAAGRVGLPRRGVYGASTGALIALARALAVDRGRGFE
jgi:NAD(P)-dependent dehydrogenase (short-subunit alcohol dehydrogenase family)